MGILPAKVRRIMPVRVRKSGAVFRYIDKNFRTVQRKAKDTVNMP